MLEDVTSAGPALPAALVALALAMLVAGRRHRRGIAAAETLLGVGLGALALAIRLHAPVPDAGEAPAVVTLLDAPRPLGYGCRATAWIHGASGGRADLRLLEQQCALVRGDRFVARLRLHEIPGAANPGGRDPARERARYGVRRRAEVVDGAIARIHPAPSGGVARIESLRRRIAHVLDPPDAPTLGGALQRALVLGDRSGLSEASRRAFASSGTAHLLAVSGLHVAWAFGVIRFGVGVALWWVPSVRVQRRRPGAALVCGIAGAVGYSALAGLGVPAVRAALMAAVGSMAIAAGRLVASWNALGLAGLVLLAVEPAVLFDAGFALSFSAVAGLLLWQPQGSALRTLLACTIAASLATAPLVAAIGAPVPASSLVANAVAVPWFGAVVVPLGLLASIVGLWVPPLLPTVRSLAILAAEIGLRIVDALGGPDLLRAAAHPVCAAMAAAAGGFAMRLRLRGAPHTIVALLFAASAVALAGEIAARVRPPHVDPPALLFLSVGHGDAVLVRSGGRAWLVDAGARGPGFDAGRHVVLPALRAEGVRRLDALILTHADLDHVGGAVSVLEGVRVGEVWLASQALEAPAIREVRRTAARHRVPIRLVGAGDLAALPGVRARLLWPPRGRRFRESNDSSLVLRIETHDGVCALLPGDAPARVERELAPGIAPCAVLKLGHHGSLTSTDPAWLAALSPRVAIASAGRRERSPLPHPTVRRRLERAGVEVFETEPSGAIRVELAPDGPHAHRFRRGAGVLRE